MRVILNTKKTRTKASCVHRHPELDSGSEFTLGKNYEEALTSLDLLSLDICIIANY